MLLVVRPPRLTCNCARAYTARWVSAPLRAFQAGEDWSAIPCTAAPSRASMPRRLIVRRVSAVRGSCGYVVRVHAPPPVPRWRVAAPVTRLVWNTPFVLVVGDVWKEGEEGCASHRGLSYGMCFSSSAGWCQQAGPGRLGQACLVSSRQPSFDHVWQKVVTMLQKKNMHAYVSVCACMRVYVHVYMYVYVYMYVCVYVYIYIYIRVRVVYICTRVGAFCLFVMSNLFTTCACITGVS